MEGDLFKYLILRVAHSFIRSNFHAVSILNDAYFDDTNNKRELVEDCRGFAQM